MKFNIFKKKKEVNNIIVMDNTSSEKEMIDSEKELLLRELNEDKIQYLCFYHSMDKKDLSLHLLKILKDNPILFDKLKYVDEEMFKKINNDTLTLEEIPTYKLELLDLPIFNKSEERRIKLLKKKLEFKNSNYSFIRFDKFQNNVTTNEVIEDIPSYIDSISIKKVSYVLPIEKDNFYIDSKFTFVFPCDTDVFDENTTVNFDENTIIITDYLTFIELTKNNIDLVEKYNFVLDNDYERVKEIENLTIFNKYNDNFFKTSDNFVIKLNHLLYLVDNSNMEEDRKKYYSYYLKKGYFDIYNYSNFLELVKKLTDELGMNYIKEYSDKFNDLLLKMKKKEIKEDEFDVSIFITGLGNLANITCIDLIKKINNLSKEQRELVYENDVIKNKLKIGFQVEASNDLYKYYREVSNYIEPREFLNLYKNEGIVKYFKNSNKKEIYKIFVCFCERGSNALNEVMKCILEDDVLFNEFFGCSDYFYSMFSGLDYELLKQVIFKIEKSDFKYKFDFLCSVDYESQIKLLNEDIKDETILKMMPFLKNDVVSYFFENNIRAKHLYRYVDVASLVRDSDIKFSSDIVKSKDFFDKLKCSSFIKFRDNINNVEKCNDPIYIEERLRNYYDELLSSYNSDSKMFKEYENFLSKQIGLENIDENDYILSMDAIFSFNNFENNEEVIDNLQKITSKKISEIVIDALFQDNIYNVWLNIKEMIRYNEMLTDDEKVLNKEKLEFYKLILDFDNVDSDTKIEIYNKLKDKNYNLIFYEDLRKLKDLSYDKIQESMLNPMVHSEYLDKTMTDKYGVDVYDLRDKEYTMLIRRELNHHDQSQSVRNCYSLISNENSQVFGGPTGYLYGYNTFEKDKILHVLETDSFSSSQKDNSSKYVNRVMLPKEIVNGSNWYSEVQIVNTKSESYPTMYDTKSPDYIVVFETVLPTAVAESKRLNIPIVIISDQKLEDDKKIDIKLDDKKDIYVNDYFTEITRKNSR